MRVQIKDGEVMDFTKPGAVPEPRAYTVATTKIFRNESVPTTITLPPGFSVNQEHFVSGLTTAPIEEEEEPAQHCVSVFESTPIDELDFSLEFEKPAYPPKIDGHVIQVVKQRLEALEVFGSYITEEQSGYARALKWVLEVAK